MQSQEEACHGRFGYISAYDAKKHRAKVIFPDKDDFVSVSLPVLVSNTLKNKDEYHVDVGEHVFCMFLGNGLEQGVIFGSIWDDTNTPPVGDENIRQTTFEDGTVVKYDRKNHKLEIECEGDIDILAKGNITVRANGNMHTYGAVIDHN